MATATHNESAMIERAAAVITPAAAYILGGFSIMLGQISTDYVLQGYSIIGCMIGSAAAAVVTRPETSREWLIQWTIGGLVAVTFVPALYRMIDYHTRIGIDSDYILGISALCGILSWSTIPLVIKYGPEWIGQRLSDWFSRPRRKNGRRQKDSEE